MLTRSFLPPSWTLIAENEFDLKKLRGPAESWHPSVARPCHRQGDNDTKVEKLFFSPLLPLGLKYQQTQQDDNRDPV
jgi:hypothetical protein